MNRGYARWQPIFCFLMGQPRVLDGYRILFASLMSSTSKYRSGIRYPLLLGVTFLKGAGVSSRIIIGPGDQQTTEDDHCALEACCLVQITYKHSLPPNLKIKRFK
jgi:hypothetical protein